MPKQTLFVLIVAVGTISVAWGHAQERTASTQLTPQDGIVKLFAPSDVRPRMSRTESDAVRERLHAAAENAVVSVMMSHSRQRRRITVR
jgi:hypothetical protein